MKHLKNITVFVLILAMLSAFIPFAFSSDNTGYANADCEAYYEGMSYEISEENGKVFRSLPDSESREYLTSYEADRIAVYKDNLYVLTENGISVIDLNDSTCSVYCNGTDIDSFAVSDAGVYILSDGSIKLISAAQGEPAPVITSGIITDFWLDSADAVSYMTDGKYIFTRSLADGEETAEANQSSYLDDYYKEESDGTFSTYATIATLRTKFPSGKYWNHTGTTSRPDSYTSSGCSSHSNCNYNGSCGCNSFCSAIQCMGYAYKCAYDVYGQYGTGWSKVYNLNSLKAGDIIRYKNDGHSIFVIGVSGNSITYTDCNSDGHCVIRWDRTVTKSTVNASLSYVRTAPYEAEGGSVVPTPDPALTKYTISFNANGGSTSGKSVTVYEGNAYGELPDATRTGYVFDGWFTAQTGGTKVTEETIADSDVTLYAHWTIISYTVKFNANGGSGTMPADFVKDYGASYTFNTRVPTRTGYTYKEWNTAADGTGTSYRPGGTYSANEDATLYAQWQGNTYHAYLYPEGGSGVSAYIDVVFGSAYGNLPVPTREGYDFAGWYLDKSFSSRVTSSTIVSTAGTHSLYAKWTEQIYTITYDANGGTGAPSAQTKNYNINVTISSSQPTRTGFIFKGWNTKPDGTGTSYTGGSSYSYNTSLYLYAQWEREVYTITFDSNGNSTETIPSQKKQYGIDLTLTSSVPAPSREGIECTGWNTRADGKGTSYAPGATYRGNGSVTLYAQWDTAKYRITFDADGGTGAPSTQIKVYDEDITLVLTTPTRTGYNFLGWYDADGTKYSNGQVYSVNAPLKLTASWEKIKYVVTYNSNYGTAVTSKGTKVYDEPLTLTGGIFTRAGYTCTGWTTKADGTGTSYSIGSSYTDNGPVTLYAQWKANTYTITFDPYGTGRNTFSGQYTYDSTYTLAEPSKTGYDFGNWYRLDSYGREITISNPYKVDITASTTFHAAYDAKTYELSFSTGDASVYAEYDSSVPALPVPEKEGYVFAGWFTSGGEQIKENDTLSAALLNIDFDSSTVIELNAMFVPAAYTVTFDADGGTAAEAISVSDGEAFGTLPETEKEGYNFLGWYYGSTKITAASVYDYSSSITLTAKWQAETYTVTFDAAGGSCSTQKASVTYGKAYGTLPTASFSGYVFCGWINEDGDEVTASTVYGEPGNTTLTASYVSAPSSDKITFVADGRTVSTVSSTALPADEPAVPAKTGYTGAWEAYDSSSGGKIVKAVYTPETYTVTFVADGVTAGTAEYSYGDVSVTEPSVPAKSGYKGAWASYELAAADVTVNAVYTPEEYTAQFIADGKEYASALYTVGGEITLPDVPEKDGYTYYWGDYELTEGGTVIFAERRIDYFDAVFMADGEEVATFTYTVLSDSVDEPDVPAKNGYTGHWENYKLQVGGTVINAVYEPNTYTVTFMDGKPTVVSYVYGASSVAEPAVPQRTGYNGSWGAYELGYKNSTVYPVYDPIYYTATFISNGNVVGTTQFTVEHSSLEEPEVPIVDGLMGTWSSYTIAACDMTIYAEYVPTAFNIAGYVIKRTESYMTTVVFTTDIKNLPSGYEIHWFVDGTDKGTGDTYSVKEAKKGYSIHAEVYKDGQSVGTSATEQVNIKTANFLQMIICFFKKLFGTLPVVYQK